MRAAVAAFLCLLLQQGVEAFSPACRHWRRAVVLAPGAAAARTSAAGTESTSSDDGKKQEKNLARQVAVAINSASGGVPQIPVRASRPSLYKPTLAQYKPTLAQTTYHLPPLCLATKLAILAVVLALA